nr:glycoside hydrolase family 95 protein [Enterococcus nangangensis]
MPKIIFKQPTKDWNEGLPIGNGRLGAMIMGNPENTHLQCNEDTLWQGGFRNRNNPAAKQNLEKIRQLILAEKTRAAEELIQAALTGVPEFQRHYEPAGDIFIRNLSHGEVSDYVRTLDLATAVVTESYQLGENRYHTEMFASKPAQLMAYCVTSSQKSNTKFRLHLNRSRGIYDQFYSITNEDSILLGISGVTSDGGVQYAQFAKIVTDGKMELVRQYVVIEEFTTLMIYTTIATTYRQKDPAAYCQKILGAADIVAYEKIKAAHIEDYQKLYQTVSLDLGGQTATADVPTLLANAQKGQVSPYLIEIMFQFGRYLLIASSRPGSLPANLQGIWNKEMLPAWDAKYTININTEMDYWPAEKVGLSECHLALFDHLLTMYPNGQQTAETMYGLKGFVAHHNTDVWGDTAPQDDYLPATYWPFGGAWLCLHIWHHYEYTQDKEFLAKYFFLLEEAACFMAGFVMELPNGEMVTNPSVSPENSFLTKSGEPGYVSYGSTMDNQLLWELFTDYLAGCQLTEHDSQLVLKVQEILPKLPPHKIGKYGQLMEWYHDYE